MRDKKIKSRIPNQKVNKISFSYRLFHLSSHFSHHHISIHRRNISVWSYNRYTILCRNSTSFLWLWQILKKQSRMVSKAWDLKLKDISCRHCFWLFLLIYLYHSKLYVMRFRVLLSFPDRIIYHSFKFY